VVWIRLIAGVLVALVIGFFGLSLVFSDLGPGETDLARTLATVATFVGGAFLTGLIVGRRLWPLSLLSAWGPILLGLVSPRAFLLVNVGPPILLALLGGYASVLAARALTKWRTTNAA
jgi:hypothetical protein